MKALLLINEKSGAVQSVGVDNVIDLGKTARALVPDLTLDIIHADAETLIDACKKHNDVDLVIAAGGDGTQAAIASAILNTETSLLPLPCGTLNMFCRDLGIPLEIGDALAAGLKGKIQKVDVGVIGDRVFVNNVVIGSYAEVAEAREELRDAKSIDEVSFGLVAAADALFHAEPMKFRITLDDQTVHLETNTVIISNNALTGAENLVPNREQLDEGLLYVYLAEAVHGGDFAGLIAEFVRGAAEDSAGISMHPCKRCIVSAVDERFSYSVDGDPLETDGPLAFEIRAGALNIMAP